jgi:hypothetical protein
MTTPSRHVLEKPANGRATPRPSLRRVRSWTGRSAVAYATDSHVSKLATAGTRVTRVSAMRIPSARPGRFTPPGAALAAGHASSLRRMDPRPPITSG